MNATHEDGMVEECGRVVALEPGRAWIATLARTGCGRCEEPGGCGRHSVLRMFGSGQRHVLARTRIEVQPGDNVVIGIREGLVLRASLLLYLLPLAGLLAGAVIGHSHPSGGEGASILAAAGGMAGGFLLARFWSRRVLRDADWLPEVLRRLPAG